MSNYHNNSKDLIFIIYIYYSVDVPVNQSDRINSYNITVRPNEIITIDSECEIGPETAKKIRKSINFKIKLCAYGPDNRKLKKVNISEWEWPKDVTTGVIPQFNMSYDELFMINQLSYLRWEIFYSTSSPTRKCSKYYITCKSFSLIIVVSHTLSPPYSGTKSNYLFID